MHQSLLYCSVITPLSCRCIRPNGEAQNGKQAGLVAETGGHVHNDQGQIASAWAFVRSLLQPLHILTDKC